MGSTNQIKQFYDLARRPGGLRRAISVVAAGSPDFGDDWWERLGYGRKYRASSTVGALPFNGSSSKLSLKSKMGLFLTAAATLLAACTSPVIGNITPTVTDNPTKPPATASPTRSNDGTPTQEILPYCTDSDFGDAYRRIICSEPVLRDGAFERDLIESCLRENNLELLYPDESLRLERGGTS